MKKIFCIVLIVLTLFVSVGAQGTYMFSDSSSDVLTLESELQKISSQYGFPVYGALTSEYSGEIMYCADQFYASRSLGSGSEKTGILLYVDPVMREYYIYVHGDNEVFTDDALIYIEDEIYPYLEESDFYGAFSAYISASEEILELYENGASYKAPFNLILNLIIALVIGLIAGLITVSVMKSKMTSVRFNDSARQYTVNNSFKLNLSRDIFLYRTVSRVKRPENNTSSGSHRSASGGSFRGRGGSF